VKQLLWTRWEQLIFDKEWHASLVASIDTIMEAVRMGAVGEAAEALKPVGKLIHFLKVVAKPAAIDSDPSVTKAPKPGAILINPRAPCSDRFHSDFLACYQQSLQAFVAQSIAVKAIDQEAIDQLLQFWNEEEGRMALLRFDRDALISVRKSMKEWLLLPHLAAFKNSFKAAIQAWNLVDANRIFRLLSNRKTLLVELDQVAAEAFMSKGRQFLKESGLAPGCHLQTSMWITEDAARGQLFIRLMGQFYKLTTELIQLALATRPEMLEARLKVVKQLLNSPPSFLFGKHEDAGRWTANSLAECVSVVFGNHHHEDSGDMGVVLLALFRLLDNKDVFMSSYAASVGRRALSEDSFPVLSTKELRFWQQLKETCGANYVAPLDRIAADMESAIELNKRRARRGLHARFSIITSGTWYCDGKLLPGHPLASIGHPSSVSLPEVNEFEAAYVQLHPKRHLTWLPVLSTVDCRLFDHLPALRLSFVQYAVLQLLQDNQRHSLSQLARNLNWPNKAPPLMLLIQPLIQIYLVNLVDECRARTSDPLLRLQDNWKLLVDFMQEELKFEDIGAFLREEDTVCDLAQLSLVLLNSPHAASNTTNALQPHPSNSSHNGSSSHPFTPLHHASTVGSNSAMTTAPISTTDRFILLQSTSTRLLKQLRRISLQELYNQLSMLPVLLTRFSPTMEEVMQALWQLAEKEFAILSIAGGHDDDITVADEDGKRLLDFTEYQELMKAACAGDSSVGEGLIIKYLP